MLEKSIKWGAVVAAVTILDGDILAKPVFPDAVGFGVETSAGRGGKIIRVTNLENDGAGSLRACVEESGPRYCLFEVSGTILLKTDLAVRNPNLTIAGQTAPAPGIMLRGNALNIAASDVLVQHLASRVGGEDDGTNLEVKKALKINGKEPVTNIVVDHCSLSWAVDENLSTYKNWGNVTISNTIISEPLRDSVSKSGSHGYGALIDSNSSSTRITFVGNLFAHGYSRNPRANAAEFAFVNNVVYNPGVVGIMLYNDYGLTTKNSIVGNVFIEGANTVGQPIRIVGSHDAPDARTQILAGTKVYVDDNIAWGNFSDPLDIINNQSIFDIGDLIVSAAPTWPQGLNARSMSSNAVLEQVLKKVGSRPAERDAVDRRIVSDVKNRTGQIINCVANDGTSRCSKNAGGWPEFSRNVRSLDIPANPHGDGDNDGYTNIEEWLHDLSAEVEGRSSSSTQNDTARPLPPELQD